MPPLIRFENGATYERFMGTWSQLVGGIFLQWLAQPPGLRWLDVGCGNGAFTELIVSCCAPSAVAGIDPSEAQLSFARSRPGTGTARFAPGDAMALPFGDATFDVAVMPLALAFVPEPARGVAEMVRVVRPGGVCGAYMWDLPGVGTPYEPLFVEMRSLGVEVAEPPRPEAAGLDAMRQYWSEGGLEAVTTRVITVTRTFADFREYWDIVLQSPSAGPTLRTLPPGDTALLQDRMRARLSTDAAGRITCAGRANAVMGRVPG